MHGHDQLSPWLAGFERMGSTISLFTRDLVDCLLDIRCRCRWRPFPLPLPGAQIQVFKVGVVGPPTFWFLRRMAKVAHVPFDGVHLSWRRRFQVERAQWFGVEEMVLGIIYIMYIYIIHIMKWNRILLISCQITWYTTLNGNCYLEQLKFVISRWMQWWIYDFCFPWIVI